MLDLHSDLDLLSRTEGQRLPAESRTKKVIAAAELQSL